MCGYIKDIDKHMHTYEHINANLRYKGMHTKLLIVYSLLSVEKKELGYRRAWYRSISYVFPYCFSLSQ